MNHLDFLTPSTFPLLPCFFYFPPLTYCVYSSASLDQFLKPQKRHLLLKLDLLLSGSLKVNNGTLSPNNNHYFPPNVPEALLKCSTIAPYRQFTSVKGHLQVQYLKICHKELWDYVLNHSPPSISLTSNGRILNVSALSYTWQWNLLWYMFIHSRTHPISLSFLNVLSIPWA